MTNLNAESPYVAQYGVTPTRAQFEGACLRLEAHLSELKRVKLEALSPEALGAEYVRYHGAFQRLEEFNLREVGHFMKDWWRIDPIEDVDRVRRRSNRQRNLAIHHLMALKAALLSRGPAGIEVLKTVFVQGDPELSGLICDVAIDHFPDEAEPVIEAMLSLPRRVGHYAWYRDTFRDALQTIRGYRARRVSSLSPQLGGDNDAGMAPMLSTLDKPPSEFPELLFERFAVCVFTGEATFEQALNAAWKEVVAEKRLDSIYLDHAEFAAFDPKFRAILSRPIYDFYGETIYPERLAEYGFAYRHADGRPVSLDEMREALYHVVRHTHREPYALAVNWQRV